MSYEWIRRRRLGLWYVFPELVAPWIQFKRGMLRVLWFFTHPVDEFFETIGEILAWPFVVLSTFFAWVSAGIGEFFDDLVRGVQALFRSLGRLPVWTGAAIAGSLGVILTTMLFFLSLIQFRPVPASISHASEAAPLPVVEQPEVLPDDSFDPFASTGAVLPEPAVWEPPPTARPTSELSVRWERLSLPPGWDSRRRFEVVSTETPAPGSPFDSFRHQAIRADGWTLTRTVRRRDVAHPSMPYVSRHGVRGVHVAPNWIAAAESVGPFQRVEPFRQPAVTVSRSAPTTAVSGGALTYELIVENQGAEPLDNVTIREVTSALDRVLDVDPPAGVEGEALVWNLAQLEPGEQRRLTIELKPDELGPITGGSTVHVTTSIAAVSRVSAPRPRPSVIIPEPSELMASTPPPQAEPPVEEPEASPPEIGMILPSFGEDSPPEAEPEPPESTLTFEPEPIDPPPAMLFPDPNERELTVMPARAVEEPEVALSPTPIDFKMQAPKLVSLDSPVPAVFEVRNPGSAELTDLVIQVRMTDELDHSRGRTLRHRIERISPGQVYRTRLTATAVGDGIARLSSTLTTADDVETTAEAAVKVGPSPPKAAPRYRIMCGP